MSPRPVPRRTVLKWGGIGGATTLLPAGGLAGYVWASADHSNIGNVRFERQLRIPPLATTYQDQSGRVRVDLDVREGLNELLPGKQTVTWGVNGSYLGPTLRVRRGDTFAPRVRNRLPEITTMHWHGMELPGDCDGGPHQPITTGKVWSPSWTVDQPPATLWYHPHPHGATKEHVYRGVAGLLIVDDPRVTHPLPSQYGVDDIPVIVQDKNFTDDGALDLDGISFSGTDVIGLLGSEILVNGTWGPVFDVGHEMTRLRILNASNARIYDLVFDDERRFQVIATDSGLLPEPVETDHVLLSPGERSELLIRMRPGETVRLNSRPPDIGGNLVYHRLAGGDDEFEILELRADDGLRRSSSPPGRFSAPEPISEPSSDTEQRTFRLADFLINDQTMAMARIDEVVPLGRSEIWSVHNDVGIPHNFHIHNAGFEVLDIDGRAPDPWMRGRKDTVFMRPGSTVRLRVEFGQYASTRWPYMFHCHLLAHEDAGMMGQFLMVKPNETDNARERYAKAYEESTMHQHD